MGIYVNPSIRNFLDGIESDIYVDKSLILDLLNKKIGTKRKLVCMSRSRRFGKSMALQMMNAYYQKGIDSSRYFDDLKISTAESYAEHLNKYIVIMLDIQEAKNLVKDDSKMISALQMAVVKDLHDSFPDAFDMDEIKEADNPISVAIARINEVTKNQFVILIDEWDAFFRIAKDDETLQKEYISFLRSLFKGIVVENAIALGYMTGIFPIKKYGTQSALNNFDEFTMINPWKFNEFFGFTEDEVKSLCERYSMDFSRCKKWYDGYLLAGQHIYNPNSVVCAMDRESFQNFWTRTESYESLREFISSNYEGLKDDIIKMLDGNSVSVDAAEFANDLTSITNKNMVLVLLIHLGYLAYDEETQKCFIPNYEIAQEFVRAVRIPEWNRVYRLLKNSAELLDATIGGDGEKVAEYIEIAHEDYSSIVKYNSEETLSSVVSLAYFSAQNWYDVKRELPSGKGFADIVFIPLSHVDKQKYPAFIVELKYDKDAETAIRQIREKRYDGALKNYADKILLVGISYDTETKKHSCMIEASGGTICRQ